MLQYRVIVDWDHNVLFGHALTDISADVIHIEYQCGFMQPYEAVSPPAQLALTLNNADGKYNVENPASPLYGLFRPGLLVALQYFNGTNWLTLFGSTIKLLTLNKSQTPPFTAQIVVGDPLELMQEAEYLPPLETNITTGQVLINLVNSGQFVWPYSTRFWMLGVAGSSELDQTTQLLVVDTSDYDAGATTLAFVGDNADAGDGVSMLNFVEEIVTAEGRGRFFFNPGGGLSFLGFLAFYSRHHYAGAGIIVDVSALVSEAHYAFGDDLVNHVEVSFEGRQQHTPGSVIYSATNVPFSISAGQQRAFNARYRDPAFETARVGAINPIPPFGGQDYIANTASDGSGTDVTGELGVAVEYLAASARVTLTNHSGATMYVTTFQLRGTPLTNYAREVITKYDADSIARYGMHKRALNLNFIDDAQFAVDYAGSWIQRFCEPYGHYSELVFRGQSVETLVFAAPLGKVITCDLAGTGLYSGETEYIIIGLRRSIDFRLGEDTVTCILEPLARTTSWSLGIAGSSELDVSTFLAL